MASMAKGIDPDRLVGIFGCEHLGAAAHTEKRIYAFIAQEDTVLTVLTGGDISIGDNTTDYLTDIGLSGVTLKQGALITAPKGEGFKSITIDSGSVIAYK